MFHLPALTGSVLVLLGAICWSLNSPLVKYLPLDPFLICALRSVIAGMVLLPLLRPRKIHWNRWLIAYCVSYCALCLSVIVALSRTSAAIGVGMQYTATVWLFLLLWYRTGYFNRRAFLPVLVIMVGVVCFMLSGGSGDSDSLGNAIALTEGIFFAAMSLSSKKATQENVLGLTALGNLFTGALVFGLFPSARMALPAMTGQEWIFMLILGVVQVAGGYGFYNLGVQKIPARKASVLALWEMILGPLWVALFLHQYPNAMVLTGFAIILVGMVLDAKVE
jgi:drug/metabolite transporter (DMT)-like permease